MNVNFNGYGENVATFLAASTLKEGNLVKITSNYTASPASSGDDFVGICVGVRDGYAAVQLSGYVEVPASAQITLGRTGIIAGGSSAVTSSQTGTKYNVIYSTASTVGFIL